VGCVHGAPAVLGGEDELERHRQSGGARAGTPGDLRAVPDGGEGRLDRVGGAQVDPVLGRVVIERQELLGVVGDLGDGLAELRAIGVGEGPDRLLGMGFILRPPDLGQVLLRARVRRFGQRREDVAGLVELMPTSA
jgi:hypothetical protein